MTLVFKALPGMDFPTGDVYGDYKTFNKLLEKYKMSFTLEEHEVDVLIIKDSEGSENVPMVNLYDYLYNEYNWQE